MIPSSLLSITPKSNGKTNAVILGAALLGYSTQIQANQQAAQAYNAALNYQYNQNSYQQQLLYNQQMQNFYLVN